LPRLPPIRGVLWHAHACARDGDWLGRFKGRIAWWIMQWFIGRGDIRGERRACWLNFMRVADFGASKGRISYVAVCHRSTDEARRLISILTFLLGSSISWIGPPSHFPEEGPCTGAPALPPVRLGLPRLGWRPFYKWVLAPFRIRALTVSTHSSSVTRMPSRGGGPANVKLGPGLRG